MNSNDIQFFLGKQQIKVNSCSPTLTLLNYLRTEMDLPGTKEGCAEGDCGACTVVLVELNDGKLTYKAVNACILFLPMLDGKQVLTVEHLKSDNGLLHPVQQAMVDNHASQCGFCTPGIAMSGYALYQNTRLSNTPESELNQNYQACQNKSEQTDCLNKTFAGNLCRCTGYGPIIESAKSFIQHALENQTTIELENANLIKQLESIAPTQEKSFTHAAQTFLQPSNITELNQALDAKPSAHLLAGATDLGLWVTKQRKKLETLIYLGQVPELKQITETDNYIELGASVTYSEALPILSKYFPQMEGYLERHSSTQIRNSGTVVGNIANGSPIGDMPPPLIALGSSIKLTSVHGSRELLLEDYFIRYGKQDRKSNEFIEKVRIPIKHKGSFSLYKISKRFEQDISSVSAAFYLELTDNIISSVRLCYGGMAATPLRAKQTEIELIGNPFNEETINQACLKLSEDYQPLSDFRASQVYRMTVAKNLLRKFFIEQSAAVNNSTNSNNIPIQILHTGGLKHA